MPTISIRLQPSHSSSSSERPGIQTRIRVVHSGRRRVFQSVVVFSGLQPHETRVFTTIAGVDAGKLRASFAAAFSEEPSERPSTASEFVASFQDAISNRRGTDEPAASVVAVPFVSDEREDPPSAPVLDMKRAEDKATLEPPARQERVVTEGRAARRRRARERRRETLATSQPLIRESHEHEPRERTPESRLARPEPIVDDALVAEVTPPRASSIDEASYGIPVQSGSRALLVAVVVAVSFAAGFGGGFIVGQHSRPSTESIDVSHHESVAEPQPTRAAVEDPKPIASTTQTVAPISKETVSSSEPMAATTQTVASVSKEKASSSEPIAATVARQPAVPAVDSGRLLVRSTPAGAGVVVDGQSRGVTPLDLRELAFGAHTIEVSHPGHDTRQRRVTLSERRPARSVDFELRPTERAITRHPGSELARLAASDLASVRGTGLRRRQFDWNDAFPALECRSGREASENRVVGLQDLDDIGSDRAECTVSSVGKSRAVRA